MEYKTFASMNIAIIGTTVVAESYALGFAKAGHEVLMAWKENTKTRLSKELSAFTNINAYSIESAAAIADLIIIATPPKDVREVSYWLGYVRRKVIIDVTCNVFAGTEEQVTTICALKAITGSSHIVKVFNTRGYEKMIRPLFFNRPVELLMAGDSKKAKAIAEILGGELGIFNCYDFGDSTDIPLFNELTRSFRNLASKSSSEILALRG